MKMYVKIGIVVLVFLTSIQVVFAAFGQVFAGRIVALKAIEVETLESAGYSCPGSNSTIEIISYKGPTSYFAPSSANRTRTTLSPNQKILGKYSGQITIECIRVNPDGTTSQENVLLDNITLFGTSKR